MLRARAIVVVAYGGTDYLREALAPLADEQVVVVDNSSFEETRLLVEQLGFTYVDAGSNLGFAGGVNVGLRHLAAHGHEGDVLLLNPDAQIDLAQLDLLQDALLAEPRLAAVAPALVGPDGAAQLTRYPLPSPSQMWRFAVGLPPGKGAQDHLIGAALLLRGEALAQIGELDERYFLYGEEVDWQRRALDGGWTVAEVPSAQALHHSGMSSDDDRVRIARVTAGQELYVRRWYGAGGSASFRAGAWVAMKLRARSGSWGASSFQAELFRLGPRRIAPIPPAPRPLAILHVAWQSDSLAGVLALAEAQGASGHQVTVLTDGPLGRQSVGVTCVQATSFVQLVRALKAQTAYDIVHAHGSASAAVACSSGAWHGTRVVASSAAGDDGPRTARLAMRALGGRVDVHLSAAAELDPADGYRDVVAQATRKRNIA